MRSEGARAARWRHLRAQLPEETRLPAVLPRGPGAAAAALQDSGQQSAVPSARCPERPCLSLSHAGTTSAAPASSRPGLTPGQVPLPRVPSPTPGEALAEQPSCGDARHCQAPAGHQAQEAAGHRRLCEKHSRVLSLFCEEDLEVLCPLCTEPPATRAAR